MAEPHDVGLAAGATIKHAQPAAVGGHGQPQQGGGYGGVNSQSAAVNFQQQQLLQQQQAAARQQQLLQQQQQQQQQRQYVLQQQQAAAAYNQQLIQQRAQIQQQHQQQVQVQKATALAMNKQKQEKIKKAVADKLKSKFTFTGPPELTRSHEGLLGIVGTLVATIYIQRGEQVASQAHLLLQNLCHPDDQQRRATTQHFTDWYLERLPQLAGKRQQIMSKLDQLLPLIRPHLAINTNPQVTVTTNVQQPVGTGPGAGAGARPHEVKVKPKPVKKKVIKKGKARKAGEMKEKKNVTGLMDSETDSMLATEVSLDDEFDLLNEDELQTAHLENYTDETALSEYHLEGLIKCQVARQLGKSAKLEEDVFKTLAIAAEERLLAVLESLSEICGNDIDYFQNNSRIRVKQNQLADQLKFLEQFGEKEAAAADGAAAAAAAANGGNGSGTKRPSSSMDVDGGKAAAKGAGTNDDDDDDDWGADIARAPRRRKVISAGDFAIWSAQNRMAGRQFKSQFKWHLGTGRSGGDAGDGGGAGRKGGGGSGASSAGARIKQEGSGGGGEGAACVRAAAAVAAAAAAADPGATPTEA